MNKTTFLFHLILKIGLLWLDPVFKTTLGVSRALGSGLAPNRKIGEYAGVNSQFVFTLCFILCMTKSVCSLVVMLSSSAFPLRF